MPSRDSMDDVSEPDEGEESRISLPHTHTHTAGGLRVIVWGHQQLCEVRQLIRGERGLVRRPVILQGGTHTHTHIDDDWQTLTLTHTHQVRAFELSECVFDGGGDGSGVPQVTGQ